MWVSWLVCLGVRVLDCCVIEPPLIKPSIASSITHDPFPLSSEAAPSAQLQTPEYLTTCIPFFLGFASLKLRWVLINSTHTMHVCDWFIATWPTETGGIGSPLWANDANRLLKPAEGSGTMLAWAPIHNMMSVSVAAFFSQHKYDCDAPLGGSGPGALWTVMCQLLTDWEVRCCQFIPIFRHSATNRNLSMKTFIELEGAATFGHLWEFFMSVRARAASLTCSSKFNHFYSESTKWLVENKWISYGVEIFYFSAKMYPFQNRSTV